MFHKHRSLPVSVGLELTSVALCTSYLPLQNLLFGQPSVAWLTPDMLYVVPFLISAP